MVLNILNPRTILFFTLLSFLLPRSNAQVNGNFTIGGSIFPTIQSAINFVDSNGINGPVIFEIKNGLYNEQIQIDHIPGASDVNRIIFKPETGASVRITNSNNSTNNYILKLTNASFIEFRNIGFSVISSANYNTIVRLDSSSSYNVFRNCEFTGKQTSQNSINHALIYSPSGDDSFNLFVNNNFTYGSYAFYMVADSLESGNQIINNVFTDQGIESINLSFQDSLIIRENKIRTSSLHSQFIGLRLENIGPYSQISSNDINFETDGFCIMLDASRGDTINRIQIINNFLRVGGNTAAIPIFIESSRFINVLNNNLYVSSRSIGSAGRTINVQNLNGITDNLSFKNNNIVNLGNGYGLITFAIGNTIIADYNNYYTPNTALGYWSGFSSFNLLSWQTYTGQDVNSHWSNPGYYSKNNLHVYSTVIDSAATMIPDIKTDIDGETRNINYPDIGADEFEIYFKDAGILELSEPTTFCLGDSFNFSVKLKNFGTDTIRRIKLLYEVQSIKDSIISQVTLPPSGVSNLLLKRIHAGTPALNLTAYVSEIDFNGDPNNQNDTFRKIVRASMNGNYVIDPSGQGDYSSFIDALSDLKEKGVCGNTTFLVMPGTYREQLVIDDIPGVDTYKTVTFKGMFPNQIDQTVITFDANNWYANYTLKLGGSHIRFEHLTFRAENTVYGIVVDLIGKQKNVVFRNNKFYGLKTTSISYDFNIINKNPISHSDSFIVFDSNEFYFGSNGLYFYADGNNQGYGNTFINNRFVNQSSSGLRLYGQIALKVEGNHFYMKNGGANSYGIYLQDVRNDSRVNRNNFEFPNGAYAMYLFNCLASANHPFIISNNFVSAGGSTNSAYGIHVSGSRYVYIFNNSVHIYSSGYYSRALNLLGNNSGMKIFNNNLSNSDASYVIYHSASGNIVSDYNNLYSLNGNFTYYNGNRNDLNAWQTNTGMDTHSISVNPGFLTNTDLHTQSLKLDSSGIKLNEISYDFDGDPRNPTHPDIGADEYILRVNDAGISSFPVFENHQCDGLINITARLSNYGIVNLDSVEIHWEINGVKQDTFKFYGLLPYLNSLELNLGTFSFNIDSNYTLKAWTHLPNGVQDELADNDSLIMSEIMLIPSPANLQTITDSICQGDTATIKAFADHAHRYYWFSDSVSGKLLSLDSFYTYNGLQQSDTLYVKAGSIGRADSLKTVFENVNLNIANGNMFDVSAKNTDIIIDSMDIHVQYPIAYKLYLFYKKGSYLNFEGDSTSWTLLDTITINGEGQGNKSRVKLRKSLVIPSGETYGIYITTNSVNYLIFSQGSASFENDDLSIASGKVLDFYFDAAFAQWATWNGQIYYSSGSVCQTERKMAIAHVKKKPSVKLPGDTTVCSSHSLVLTAEDGPGFQYDWKKYPGPIDYSTNQSITVNSSGMYFLKISDACGFHSHKVITINEVQSPVAYFELIDSSQCLKGNEFEFSNNSIPSNINYFWAFGDGDTSTDKSPKHGYSKADSFPVFLAVTTNDNCSDTFQKTIVVHPDPEVDFYFNDSIQCSMDNIFYLSNHTKIKYGQLSHEWYIDSLLYTTDTDLTDYHHDEVGNVYFKLKSSSEFGCEDSLIRSAFIKPSPEIDLGTDTILCANQHILLIPGFGFEEYLWSNDSTQEVIRVDTNGLGLGAKSFWVRVSDNGCTATDSITIRFRICGGINDEMAKYVRIYPNPTSGKIYLEYDNEVNPQYLKIFDLNGKTVYSTESDKDFIDISGLATGSYLLWLSTDRGTLRSVIIKK